MTYLADPDLYRPGPILKVEILKLLGYHITTQEEIDFHPHWETCVSCGILVSNHGESYHYYDQDGTYLTIPMRHSDGSHKVLSHGDNRYVKGEWCFGGKDLPLPKYTWFIKLLKWMMR